ncbi:hypothetical protein OG21DRAFT_611228 [Imleria badia]|nr:hypothetical protein OG21DRAFT_611228 [Imleria badia]
MSANLLLHPGKMHTFTDDLESFLHVLGWTALRYVPAMDSYSAVRRAKDLFIFDEHYREQGHSERGGDDKARAFRAGDYPSPNFQPRMLTPLSGLLEKLGSPFKSLYAVSPPTAEARKNVTALPDISSKSQLLSYAAVIQYDHDIECLQSSTWFIDMMETALSDHDKWPTDDRADESLPIDFSGGTRRQVQNRTKELQHTQKLLEDSKGLSRRSKRAASPTPEPSAKRRRGTPPASGSGI